MEEQTEKILKNLGRKIKKLRKEKAVTQKELANLVGKFASFISRLENGQVDIDIYVVVKIAYLLNTLPSELFTNNL